MKTLILDCDGTVYQDLDFDLVYFEYILFCFQYRKCTESCILNLSDQFAIIFFGDVFNYFHAVTMEFRFFFRFSDSF